VLYNRPNKNRKLIHKKESLGAKNFVNLFRPPEIKNVIKKAKNKVEELIEKGGE